MFWFIPLHWTDKLLTFKTNEKYMFSMYSHIIHRELACAFFCWSHRLRKSGEFSLTKINVGGAKLFLTVPHLQILLFASFSLLGPLLKAKTGKYMGYFLLNPLTRRDMEVFLTQEGGQILKDIYNAQWILESWPESSDCESHLSRKMYLVVRL